MNLSSSLSFWVSLCILMIGLTGCSSPSTSDVSVSPSVVEKECPVGVCWDKEILPGNANQNIAKWKAVFPSATDSFLLSSQYLDSVFASVPNSLGYRLYFGLTTEADISSLVILMTVMDQNGNDTFNPAVDANVTLLSQENGASGITEATAATYTQNWRNHFGVSQSQDVVDCASAGEGICGQLSESDKLIAALAQTYSKRSTYAYLYESGMSSTSNGMINLQMALPEVETNSYEVDIYVTTSTNLSVLDFSRPCPQGCGQGNNLNGASN